MACPATGIWHFSGLTGLGKEDHRGKVPSSFLPIKDTYYQHNHGCRWHLLCLSGYSAVHLTLFLL